MTDIETRRHVAASPASTAQSPTTTAGDAVALPDEESFGRALAAARQARGLSQGDVAAQLRLQLRQVRAIEAEDLAALPEGPFVRGFVRNYAKLVGLPAEPLLALVAARLKPARPLRDEGFAAVNPVRQAARERVSRLTVLGGAVSALLLFAVLGWWSMRPVPAPPIAPASAPVDAAKPAPAELPAPALPSPPEAEPAAAPSSALQFNFRGRSWVEVRQSDGTLLMSQNNEAGTKALVDGLPPYSLVIGNASQVDLEFRGKPVDLAAATGRSDVARLTLE